MKKIEKIGFIVAMDKELDEKLFSGAKKHEECRFGQSVTVYELDNGVTAYLAVSQIGEIFASAITTLLATVFQVDCIVNFGVVGGLRATEALCLVRDVIHYDMDLTAWGNALGEYDGFDSAYIPTDKWLTDQIASHIKSPYSEVRLASGDKFIADGKKQAELAECCNADICDMEGAGIAYSATKLGVPFAMLKAVSDSADNTAVEDYNSSFATATFSYIEAINSFVRSL